MKKYILFSLVGLFITTGALAQVNALVNPANVDIPYKKVVLDNGLRLIIHEDHKAPIVAVNVWYHVGSKNEKTGKSGFAHLFEHLMFNGSEHFNNDYFKALESIGATDLNGTTNVDRTNYFQNVPVAALDQVLWLESDRMGHLLGVIDQARLDEQRGVVQNEKRQGENQPYGREWEMATKASYPAGHPYSWTVIGSMDDLNAASLDDVKDWFKTYYGAANSVLVVAGDVKTEEVIDKVKKYFGNIPAGPSLAKPEVNIAKRTQDTRQSYEDMVTEARVSMYWNTPQWGAKESIYLDLAGMILSSGKSSRLFKKLVYEDQIATIVSAYNYAQELSGRFAAQVRVKPGNDPAKVEAATIAILDEFIKNGPTQAELDRVRAEYFANIIKGLERIGGFGGKSDILAEYEVYGGSPDAYKQDLKILAEATVADVHKAIKDWLTSGKHTIVCTPFQTYQITGVEADRSKVPALGTQPASTFPDLQTSTLKNGLKVVLAQRKNTPNVTMNLVLDAGYAADQYAKPGTASLSLNLLDEGTKTLNALEISDKLQTLGGSISSYSDLDASYVYMSTLKLTLEPSLDLYADVLLNPAFSENEFKRLRDQQLNSIKREGTQPFQMAMRALPKYLYGTGHAYSNPLTGTGYVETVNSITREDIIKFYDTWFKPNNGTLVVVGDIEMKDLVNGLEKRFDKWKKGEVPKKNLAAAAKAKTNTVYVIDKPESQQSVIMVGYLVDPYGKVPEIARESMMSVFGGDFTSRLNMNLREDKHWSYGAGSFVWDAKGQRPLLAYAPVQTDKTKESVQEIMKEFKAFVGDKPMTQEEFDRTKNNTVLQLPGRWETNGAVSGSIEEIVKYGLPDDYYKTYDKNVRALTLDEVRKVSKQIVSPEKLTWFVVGDKEKIMSGLKEVGFSEIIAIDPDGNPIKPMGDVKLKTNN
ncbi:MAG TPA: pitrilysin family protein [Chryseosolibacter sp.]